MRIALIVALTLSASSQDVSFDTWLSEFMEEARGRGYSEAVLDKTVARVSPLRRAIESDRAQPELTIGFERYFESRVNRQVIRQGRELLQQHRTLLRRIERDHGVPRRIVLAIWGMEPPSDATPGARPFSRHWPRWHGNHAARTSSAANCSTRSRWSPVGTSNLTP